MSRQFCASAQTVAKGEGDFLEAVPAGRAGQTTARQPGAREAPGRHRGAYSSSRKTAMRSRMAAPSSVSATVRGAS